MALEAELSPSVSPLRARAGPLKAWDGNERARGQSLRGHPWSTRAEGAHRGGAMQVMLKRHPSWILQTLSVPSLLIKVLCDPEVNAELGESGGRVVHILIPATKRERRNGECSCHVKVGEGCRSSHGSGNVEQQSSISYLLFWK